MQEVKIADIMKETFIQESIPEFIRKVYQLLQSNQFPSIICWGEDGVTLVIRDSDQLSKQLLPSVFNQNTMRSFVRQLNMYGFKKIRKQGNEKQLFFRNKHLMKSNIQQLIFIKRKKRGYVQKQSREVRETKTTCQRYNIFVNGVLNKLGQSFHLPSTVKQTLNPMKFLRSFMSQVNSSKPNIQSYQKLVDNLRLAQNQNYCDFLKSFKSFKQYDQIPCFKSAFSIFQESSNT